MSIATGLIALAVLGAEGPGGASDASLQFQIQVLDMEGLQWRGDAHYRLQPVTSQGMPTAWTGKADAADVLREAATTCYADWNIRGSAGSAVNAFRGADRLFVSRLKRVADGPEDGATAVGFEPDVDRLKDGFAIELTGQPVYAGIQTRVVIADTRFKAMHTARFTERVRSKDGKTATTINPEYQVPEVETNKVEGQWVIPADGMLVLSLGVHTIPDPAAKKDVVRERVVLISATGDAPHAIKERPSARKTAGRAMTKASSPLSPSRSNPTDRLVMAARTAPPAVSPNPVAAPVPMPPSIIALALSLASPTVDLPILDPAPVDESPGPTPAPPSRSFPVAIAANGSHIDLPPLPEDVSSLTDNQQTDLANPSSQARHVRHDGVGQVVGVAKACEAETAACATTRASRANRQTWKLSLADAVRIALENCPFVRVVASSPSKPTVIAPVGPGGASDRFVADVSALVRAVHQQYWAVALGQSRRESAKSAVAIMEGFEKRARSEDAYEAPFVDNELTKFRKGLVERAIEATVTERQLCRIIGVPAKRDRRILAISVPLESYEIADPVECPGALLRSEEAEAPARSPREGDVATHKPERPFTTILSGERLRSAKQSEEAARDRLEATQMLHDEELIRREWVWQAIEPWLVAADELAQERAEYNTAIAARGEIEGTILAHNQIVVAESVRPHQIPSPDLPVTIGAPTRDPSASLTIHTHAQPAADDPNQARPACLRIPIGRFGVMEIRAKVSRTPAAGRILSEPSK